MSYETEVPYLSDGTTDVIAPQTGTNERSGPKHNDEGQYLAIPASLFQSTMFNLEISDQLKGKIKPMPE